MLKKRTSLPKKHKSSIRTAAVIQNRTSKEILHEEETVDVIRTRTGKSVMLVRDVATLKLTYGYNSVGVEVGIEMPMACEPGDLIQASKNMERVEALVQKKMESKAADMKRILKTLTSRNQR